MAIQTIPLVLSFAGVIFQHGPKRRGHDGPRNDGLIIFLGRADVAFLAFGRSREDLLGRQRSVLFRKGALKPTNA